MSVPANIPQAVLAAVAMAIAGPIPTPRGDLELAHRVNLWANRVATEACMAILIAERERCARKAEMCATGPGAAALIRDGDQP